MENDQDKIKQDELTKMLDEILDEVFKDLDKLKDEEDKEEEE